jgi:membrane-associated phospholipid phosphatase
MIGTLVCVVLFVRTPSFPTPDKLLVFLTFVFMCFGQALEMLKRLVPFVALLLVYESFRSVADLVNSNVHYSFMARFDEWLFGRLPTAQLQQWWWHGHVQWYDFVFYVTYMLHFVFPIILAIFVWKLRDSFYWRLITMYVVLSFAGFLTYLFYPAAPPWMASDHGYIQPITRISSHVWYAMGIHDFPSLYNKIAPNPVAAVPSLHAAYAALLSIVVFKLFGKKWGTLTLIYPFLICLGTVYLGEHYAFDAILGIGYAFGAYFAGLWMFGHILSKAKYYIPKVAALRQRE